MYIYLGLCIKKVNRPAYNTLHEHWTQAEDKWGSVAESEAESTHGHVLCLPLLFSFTMHICPIHWCIDGWSASVIVGFVIIQPRFPSQFRLNAALLHSTTILAKATGVFLQTLCLHLVDISGAWKTIVIVCWTLRINVGPSHQSNYGSNNAVVEHEHLMQRN